MPVHASADPPIANLLIVDDEVAITDAVQRILKPHYTTVTTQRIAEIDHLLANNEINLIIMDYDLKQERKGTEIAEKIRLQYPLAQILIFTGNTDYSLLKHIINSRAVDAFINKPIEKNDLLHIVSKHYEIGERNRRDFNETISLIKRGEVELSHLTNLVDQPVLVDILLKEVVHINSTIPKLVGYNISSDDSIIAENFTDDSIIIHDQFLFAKFISTVSRLGSKFSESIDEDQIIDLHRLKVLVKFHDPYIFSYFFVNLDDVPPSLNNRLVAKSFEISQLLENTKPSQKREGKINEIIYRLNFRTLD